MKKTTTLAVLVATACLTTACMSGPKRLSRSWDNYVNQKYSEDSLVHGLLLQDVLPVYGLVGFVAAIGDALILNPYYFWSRDVWERNGTAFDYTDATAAENTVGFWPEKE